MPADHSQQARLISWLEVEGHTREQIERILAKIDEYDARTQHESLFDAIDRGAIDLQAIIKEVVGEIPPTDLLSV